MAALPLNHSGGASAAQEASAAETSESVYAGNSGHRSNRAKKGISVEELVLKESRQDERGGWAGVHCESSLVMTLMMLLLWEEVFDPTVKAAGGHCLTVSSCTLCNVEFLPLPAEW